MEIPIKMDDLGVPLFSEPPICTRVQYKYELPCSARVRWCQRQLLRVLRRTVRLPKARDMSTRSTFDKNFETGESMGKEH